MKKTVRRGEREICPACRRKRCALQKKKEGNRLGLRRTSHSTTITTHTHTEEKKKIREKEPMNVTGDGRPKAEENSWIPHFSPPKKIFHLFFSGQTLGLPTGHVNLKKGEEKDVYIFRIDAISFPSGLHLTDENCRRYIYMRKAWKRADVSAPARLPRSFFFARNISWHLCLMALTSRLFF